MIKKMLGDPTDAEVEQFMKEFDEGKHPLSDADKDALATGGFMRSLRAHTALKKAQAEIAALRAENNAMAVQVGVCKRAVSKLWQAVADGQYDARSIVGDETLSMKEVLFGNEWPPVDKLREIAGELGKAVRMALSKDFDCPDDVSSNRTSEIREQLRTTLARWTEIEGGKG